MTERRLLELKKKAWNIRRDIVEMLYAVKTGHPGGSLSTVEILTVLYCNQMNINPKDPRNPDRDRFIASKGHCAPAVYATLANIGYFDKKILQTLRQTGSMLQGHPDMKRTPGIDMSTGSLGLGLSVAIGMGIAAKLDNKNYYTYVLIGDGEIQEGQIWESLMSAVKYKVDNVITILDYNKVQLDGTTDEIMPLGDITAKFKAFGFNVINVDGHEIAALNQAIEDAKKVKGIPSIIIAHTVKGKGVSFMEGKNVWHGKALSEDDYKKAVAELEGEMK